MQVEANQQPISWNDINTANYENDVLLEKVKEKARQKERELEASMIQRMWNRDLNVRFLKLTI